VGGGDDGADAASCGPAGFDAHPFGATGGHQVVQDLIGDVLVKNPLVAEGLEIELEALEFDAERTGNVSNHHRAEIRLAGLGAEAGELGGLVLDEVFALRVRIGEGLYCRVCCSWQMSLTINSFIAGCKRYLALSGLGFSRCVGVPGRCPGLVYPCSFRAIFQPKSARQKSSSHRVVRSFTVAALFVGRSKPFALSQ